MQIEFRRNTAKTPWSYAALDEYQRALMGEILSGSEGKLLMSELAPVITGGRRASEIEFQLPRELYAKNGVQIFETDRGGKLTYHGPGQWVAFPVEKLERLTGDTKGVRKAVRGLLEASRFIGEKYRGDVKVEEGDRLGVWTSKGKLASVGVRIEKGILLHGVALNVFPTKESFFGINPCGLDAVVDFLFPKGCSEEEFLQVGEDLSSKLMEIFHG